jgi:hypothetical protein
MTPLSPISDDLLAGTFAALTPTILPTPYEALALDDLRAVLATSVWQRDWNSLSPLETAQLDHAISTYAEGQGWTCVPSLQNPQWRTYGAAYLRPLQPDLPRLEGWLGRYFATHAQIPYADELLYAGRTA